MSICQRDLWAGALSEQAMQIKMVISQFDAWIASKMTPCCQITDTDQAFLVKCAARSEQQVVWPELKQTAVDTSEPVNIECGP